MLSYSSLGEQSIFHAYTGWITLRGKNEFKWNSPFKMLQTCTERCHHTASAFASIPHTHTHTRALSRTYVYCLIRRCSKRSIPDSREKNLRMRALRELCCKGSSWLLLIPRFCNTYNTYIWGGHPEHTVPLPSFKYSFMWTLDVAITLCIQTEVLLVPTPRSRCKQKGRTWMQIQMLDTETKLLMVFYELPFLSTCFCVWNNVVLRQNHYDNRYLKICL